MAVILTAIAAGLVGGSVALDGYVERHRGQIVEQLSTRLGRKVEVGRLSASIFSGLTAEKVTIGGLPGEQGPLLTAERVHVRPALLPTLATLGRRARISEIEVIAPAVNVERLADGSLNLDHLGQAKSAKPGEPMDARARRMIENAQIRRASIAGGSVRFLQAAQPTVEISRIDLTLTDVGIKTRPSVDLHAAVLGSQPNFALQAQLGSAGDLEHLPPSIESARVQLSPTELAPLLPFLPSGLEAGVASADLQMKSTAVKGSARLSRARIEGGAPFDATLDVDAQGDARNADIRRLEVVAGEMSLVARGKLISLAKEPRFENFTVESRNLDFDRLRRIDPQLDRQMGAVAHGPVRLQASGSGQELTAFVDLTDASVNAPGRFDKPRGTAWRIDLKGRTQKNLLQVESQIRIAQQLLRANGSLHLGEPHPQLEARATTEGLPIAALAPLLPSLAGLPPMVISLDAKLSGRAGLPDSFAIDAPRVHVTSRKTDLVASVKARNLSRPQIEVSLDSGYLDTDDLTPPSSQGKSKKGGGAPPAALAHLNGHVAASVTRGSVSGVAFDGLRADLAIKDGTVHANKLEVGAWGGRFSGEGSDFDVARGPFHLVGHADKIDSEQLLARLGAARKIMSGRLTAQIDVHGRGSAPAELEKSLMGTLEGSVEEAQLLAFNFDELLAGQLVRALPFRIPTQRLGNATNLGTLHGQLRFADGAVVLTKPLSASTPEGPLELAGRFFFDGRLDLTGTLQLQPSAASALFAGRLRPSGPLPLSLHFGGTIHSPQLGIANLSQVAQVLVKSVVGSLIPGKQEAKIPSLDSLKGLFRR